MGSIVTVTPSSRISASQRKLSPDSIFNNSTRPAGMVINIEPLFFLILVVYDIFIFSPIVFPVNIFVILPFISITILISIKPEGLYTSTNLNTTRNPEGFQKLGTTNKPIFYYKKLNGTDTEMLAKEAYKNELINEIDQLKQDKANLEFTLLECDPERHGRIDLIDEDIQNKREELRELG